VSGLDTAFWLGAVDALAAAFAAEEAVLCGYDGAIGDGDHGSSMVRGFQEAQGTLRARPASSPAEVFIRLGEAFMDNVGGVTGMVFGTLFVAAGRQAEGRQAQGRQAEGRQAAGVSQVDAAALHAMFAAGLAAVKKVGKATEGDKSMLDALSPAVHALDAAAQAGQAPAQALREAARAAEAGRDATRDMEARVGRARYQAGKGAGHVDAGAASVCLLFQSLGAAAGSYSS